MAPACSQIKQPKQQHPKTQYFKEICRFSFGDFGAASFVSYILEGADRQIPHCSPAQERPTQKASPHRTFLLLITKSTSSPPLYYTSEQQNKPAGLCTNLPFLFLVWCCSVARNAARSLLFAFLISAELPCSKAVFNKVRIFYLTKIARAGDFSGPTGRFF